MIPERFEKAFKVLLDAFMNDTLQAGSCVACAVGNIVASSMGATLIRKVPGMAGVVCKNESGDYINNEFWSDLFCGGEKIADWRYHRNEIKRLKELTGYSAAELARIERAFERNSYEDNSYTTTVESHFRGLSAVVKEMVKMDNIPDAECYINKLREHPLLKTKLEEAKTP